jgi:hypothetical protein
MDRDIEALPQYAGQSAGPTGDAPPAGEEPEGLAPETVEAAGISQGAVGG